MRTVIIDARCIDTVAGLQRYIQHVLDLPAYYGRNLDALYDVLRETDRQTRIVLLSNGQPGAEMAAYLPRLTRVLEDASRENECLTFEGIQIAEA